MWFCRIKVYRLFMLGLSTNENKVEETAKIYIARVYDAKEKKHDYVKAAAAELSDVAKFRYLDRRPARSRSRTMPKSAHKIMPNRSSPRGVPCGLAR